MGFGVLYRRTAAGAVVDAAAVVVAAGGTAEPFPAETDGATARPRVIGGFHGLQNEV